MARQHADDVQYRVVLPSHIPDRPIILGPYPKQHTAQAQLTRRGRYYGERASEARVEVGQVLWRPVGTEEDVVLITRAELDALKESDRELSALHAWGVDNWEGYEDAMAEKDPDE